MIEFKGDDCEESWGEESGRILIVRHAQSASNAGMRTLAPTAIAITELGRRQAVAVSDVICERPSLIAVSRYVRTVLTAEPLVSRYPGVPAETWEVEEFTYLDLEVCAGTDYRERGALRESYWQRCDPSYVDGPGCESFAEFVERVKRLRTRLGALGGAGLTVVYTHGFVIKALLWLESPQPTTVEAARMADFWRFSRETAVENCAILRAAQDGKGGLRILVAPSVQHLPPELRSE